jgi:lysozyme
VKDLSKQEIFDWFAKEEGIRYTKYPDAGGFSIGLGHFIKPNEDYLLNKTLTQKEVLDLFNEDIKWVNNSINKNVKVPINKNQRLALMSLVYNIGAGAFEKSTLLRRLNEKNYSAAALEFPRWRLSQGKINFSLEKRRKKEQELFSKPV